MELWYTEKQTPALGFSCKVKKTVYRSKTQFQELAILDTFQFGRMLILDGMVQLTSFDEFIYHEMIVHVPLRTHPHPQKVLVVGGGDGGAVREVVKYPEVKKIILAEIDRQVVEAAKCYLPQLSSALQDPRVELRIVDGLAYVRSQKNSFDIIIVDSTEPVGPAKGLFSLSFYESIFKALKSDGILVVQSESPFLNADLLATVYGRMKTVFPHCYLYLASIPTYPSGLWSFMLATKRYNPCEPAGTYLPPGMRYYTPEIHRDSFSLPRFVQKILQK